MLPTGTLYIRPVSAKLLHDTELIGKMDPYVKIIVGSNFQRTPAAKRQHLTPSWDSEFVFELTGVEDLILFEVYDKELITKDDLIGSGSVSLSTVQNNTFSQWIPLAFKGKDAGALLVELRFAETSGKTTLAENLPQTSYVTSQPSPILTENVGQSYYSHAGSNLEPIIHTETINTKLAPQYIHETPIVHERKIITEKPIITERTEIYTEQPVTIEKHELREQHYSQRSAPIVQTDAPTLFKEETQTTKPNFTGPAIVQHQTEFRTEAAEYRKETPHVHQKQIITEQPVIHEKEIIHREVPIIHERPELHQTKYKYSEQTIHEAEQTKFLSKNSNEMPEIPAEADIHTEQLHQTQQPIFTRERPEIFEKRIIQEKQIIHEQPLLYAEQQVVVEKPEVRETRVFHQEQPVLQREKEIKRTDISQP